jgi:hypothetical protein
MPESGSPARSSNAHIRLALGGLPILPHDVLERINRGERGARMAGLFMALGRPIIAPQRFATTSQLSALFGRMRTVFPITAARPQRAAVATKSGGACMRSATSNT